jgi:hypothetical protein
LKRWWKALLPSNLLLMRTALSRALTEPSFIPILLNLKHCFIGHFVVVYCLGLLLCVLLLVWYCIIYIWSCLQASLVWKFAAIWFGARPRLAQRLLSSMFRLLLPCAAVWAMIRQCDFQSTTSITAQDGERQLLHQELSVVASTKQSRTEYAGYYIQHIYHFWQNSTVFRMKKFSRSAYSVVSCMAQL